MLTVVILSAGAKRIFDGARMYFAPFEETDQVVFCEWNEASSADSLSDALPGLREAIRGKGDWRAIVVESAPDASDPAQRTARDNPFDYLDNTGRDALLLDLKESRHPIVRLSHALLGYPAMGAKSFERVLRYSEADARSGQVRRVARRESELEAAGTTLRAELAAARKDTDRFDVQVQLQEVPYSAEEVAEHERLAERYRMRDVRPVEVVFIATRPPLETDPKVELIEAWRTEGEHDASRFVERNDYPPSSRFAVFDLPSTGHSSYEKDVLRFWLSVLALAVNQLPPSAVQADRVYRLDVLLSETQLAGVLNTHMSRLTAIREHLTRLVRQPARPPEATVEDKVKPQRVHVEFDRLGGDRLVVEAAGYGLAADRPRPELPRWQQEVDRLGADADVLLRTPRRLLLRSVWEARAKAESFPAREIELSELERAEVEDELRRRMARLAQPATTDILDGDRLRRLIAEHDARIAARLRQRLRRRTIGWSLALVLAVWVLGLAPYVVLAGRERPPALLDSVLVALVVLALMLLAVLGALLVLRRRLVLLIRGFNRALRAYSTTVTSGAALFAEYLSDLATYRFGRALLVGASDRQARDAGRLTRLTALRTRIERQIDLEKELVLSLGEPLVIQRTRTGVAEFDPDDDAAVRALFRLPVGESKAAFNSSGERIDAPYDFVTALEVERIRLFEQDAEVAAVHEDVHVPEMLGGRS